MDGHSFVEDMLALARERVRSGLPHLHLVFHSNTLLPGATPFTASPRDVDRFVSSLERVLSGVRELADVVPATVGEMAASLSQSTSAA